MSYILDALKKSEQARGLRKTLGLLEAPVTSPPLKSVPRWPYLIAFALVLNAGFLVFWFRPLRWGGNEDWNRNSISGGHLTETSRQTDLVGPPAPLVQTDDKVKTPESRPDEREKPALNPPAADGAQAVSSVAESEKAGERSKTESVGNSAEAVEPSKVAAAGIHSQETARDHVDQSKVRKLSRPQRRRRRPNLPPAHPEQLRPQSKSPIAPNRLTSQKLPKQNRASRPQSHKRP
jgi:hypothetical protein